MQRSAEVATFLMKDNVLRRRNCMDSQDIGFPSAFDRIDIRLPKREEPFTKQDIDSFTSAARLRVMKILSSLIVFALFIDTIHKCIVFKYTPSQFCSDLGVQVTALFLVLLFDMYLHKFAYKLTHARIGQLATGAYLSALLVYVGLSVKFSAVSSIYTDSEDHSLRGCDSGIGLLQVSNRTADEDGTQLPYRPDREDLILRCAAKVFHQYRMTSCIFNFHELMVFAVSCVLVALMPLSPLLIFSSQMAATSTLVSNFMYWDEGNLGNQSNIQMGILAILPRGLLSLGVTVFAMHQQRFLHILMKEGSLTKEGTQEMHKNQMLGMLDYFTSGVNQQFRYCHVDSLSDNISLHPIHSSEDLQRLVDEDVEGGVGISNELAASSQLPTEDIQMEGSVEASGETLITVPISNELPISKQVPAKDIHRKVSLELSAEECMTAPYPVGRGESVRPGGLGFRYDGEENFLPGSQTSLENSSIHSPQNFENLQACNQEDVEAGALQTIVSRQISMEDMDQQLSFETSADEFITDQYPVSSMETRLVTTKTSDLRPDSLAMSSADHNWKVQVRNSFIEVMTEESYDEHIQAWTDERAGIEYKSYPQLVMSGFLNTTPSSIISEPDLQSWSSDSVESDEPRHGSSSSDDDSWDVILAPSEVSHPMDASSKDRVLFSDFARVPRHPITGQLMSIGSIQHSPHNTSCRPCEWMQRRRSCRFGWRCPFCHFVDEHPQYNRRRRAGKYPKSENSQDVSRTHEITDQNSQDPKRWDEDVQ